MGKTLPVKRVCPSSWRCQPLGVVDEAFGRVLEVTDPLGAPIVLHEAQRDLYG
jgi:hypothetical protein